MTKNEVLAALSALTTEQHMQWMIDLGMQLTITARAGYPFEESPGKITHLVGFNEIQHQVYGRIRHLRRGDSWTLESFVDGMLQRAIHYKIEGDFGWALKTSLRQFQATYLDDQSTE